MVQKEKTIYQSLLELLQLEQKRFPRRKASALANSAIERGVFYSSTLSEQDAASLASAFSIPVSDVYFRWKLCLNDMEAVLSITTCTDSAHILLGLLRNGVTFDDISEKTGFSKAYLIAICLGTVDANNPLRRLLDEFYPDILSTLESQWPSNMSDDALENPFSSETFDLTNRTMQQRSLFCSLCNHLMDVSDKYLESMLCFVQDIKAAKQKAFEKNGSNPKIYSDSNTPFIYYAKYRKPWLNQLVPIPEDVLLGRRVLSEAEIFSLPRPNTPQTDIKVELRYMAMISQNSFSLSPIIPVVNKIGVEIIETLRDCLPYFSKADVEKAFSLIWPSKFLTRSASSQHARISEDSIRFSPVMRYINNLNLTSVRTAGPLEQDSTAETVQKLRSCEINITPTMVSAICTWASLTPIECELLRMYGLLSARQHRIDCYNMTEMQRLVVEQMQYKAHSLSDKQVDDILAILNP